VPSAPTQVTHRRVTFVVVGWNNADLLEGCLSSAARQTYSGVRIIYVDNGSTDGSVNLVRERFPDVDILELPSNEGFAIANNIGITHAFQDPDCEYVALLNSDCRVAADWLESLIRFAQDHPRGAGFQSPTFDYYDHSMLDSRGITITRFGVAAQLGHRERSAVISTRRVFGVNAAACVYARRFLEAQPMGAEYFDTDMWMYLEDVDLAARAVVTGWENWLVAGPAAHHMGSASSGKTPGLSGYMIYRNNPLVLVKNLPLPILLVALTGLLAWDTRALANYMRARNYREATFVIRGRLGSLRLLVRFARKRRSVLACRAASTRAIVSLMITGHAEDAR
jgi:GT2 family glycosyltransferase